MSHNQDDIHSIGNSNTNIVKGRRSIPWLWEGVLVEGAVTLLSAPEKVGKTTLLSLLLDRRRAGGELLGRAVAPGRTILCSEENYRLWALRQPPLDFGPDLIFHQPYSGCPSRGRWKDFIGDLLTLRFSGDRFNLLVIDTAVSFMPLMDRNRRTLRWALSQLELIASIPAAVLILNQSRTMQRPLAAFADIVIEMAVPLSRRWSGARSEATSSPLVPRESGVGGVETASPLSPRERGVGGEGTRRRTFTAVGRYPGTLPAVTAELNPECTDYVLLPEAPAPHAPLLATLQTLLAESPTPLTRQELLSRWPGDPPRPDTLWRTLARGCEQGLFVISGTGTKTDAFRYAVPSEQPSLAPPAEQQPPPCAMTPDRCGAEWIASDQG